MFVTVVLERQMKKGTTNRTKRKTGVIICLKEGKRKKY